MPTKLFSCVAGYRWRSPGDSTFALSDNSYEVECQWCERSSKVSSRKAVVICSLWRFLPTRVRCQRFQADYILGFSGNLPESRIQRKCEQLENVVAAVKQIVRPGQTIVDFCAGGVRFTRDMLRVVIYFQKTAFLGVTFSQVFTSCQGHVGILLAYLLPDCEVVIVENKEESIQRALERISRLQLRNVTSYQVRTM